MHSGCNHLSRPSCPSRARVAAPRVPPSRRSCPWSLPIRFMVWRFMAGFPGAPPVGFTPPLPLRGKAYPRTGTTGRLTPQPQPPMPSARQPPWGSLSFPAPPGHPRSCAGLDNPGLSVVQLQPRCFPPGDLPLCHLGSPHLPTTASPLGLQGMSISSPLSVHRSLCHIPSTFDTTSVSWTITAPGRVASAPPVFHSRNSS